MNGILVAALAALRTTAAWGVAYAYDPVLLLCTDEEGGLYPGIPYLAEQRLIEGHLLSFNGSAAPRICAGCFGSFDLLTFLSGADVETGGVRLRGDVSLTYVVGELQGGVGTLALMNEGLRADYFVNSEPTDLQALTMDATAFTFIIELVGNTRHLSKREEAVDAIAAACDLIPRLNAMRFSGAPSVEHEGSNRVHVGVMHGALGRDLLEWRPPQVSDFVRIMGSGRYAPGQTEAGALAAMRRELAALQQRFPGMMATLTPEHMRGSPVMPSFEVAKSSRIVQAINAAYRTVCGTEQPTGAITPPGYYGTDAGHLYRVGGMEGIVCGPGGRLNTMPDEPIDIVDFLDMVRVYLLAILEICELAE